MTEYRLELKDNKGLKVEDWKGKPSSDKLAEYIANYHASLKRGGPNHYIVSARGYVPRIIYARIVTMKTKKVVAEWSSHGSTRF